MNSVERQKIEEQVRSVSDQITSLSEKANLTQLLEYYNLSDEFRAITADGRILDASGFKKACTDYYGSIEKQKVITQKESYKVLDCNIVLRSWRGDIMVLQKEGDTMKLQNYAVTIIFRKIDSVWKVVYNHESGLPRLH